MNLREPCLPAGWYPRQKEKIGEFLEPFTRTDSARAAIAPHAGWYYSGRLAALSASSLDPQAETVAVLGGHLPRGIPVLAAQEDGVKTPFGAMLIDKELKAAFEKQAAVSGDRYQDNTVEVLLPMVHYFFPNAKLLWLRLPAELSSFEAGKILAKAASDLGRRAAVLGSTDLTHYGANYGFSPKGRGKAALEWVKNVNDAGFISAVLEGDPSAVLKRAEEDQSACSAGAVLGALGFASAQGKKARLSAKLLEYRTSADIEPDQGIPNSFVGYAAFSFN
jgi:AmmeMemoRadiSam system protein B